MDNEVEWYEVRPTDYYGEFLELIPVGFKTEWPQKSPKLDAALFTKEGRQLFVEWPNETVLESVVVINGETRITVDMSGQPDFVRTQKFFVPIDHYGYKTMVQIPKGVRVRVA